MSAFYKCLLLVLLVSITIVSAAQNTCPSIVEDALAQLENSCDSLSRNEACYGNGNIFALDAQGDELDDFDAVGDTVDLLNLTSLELSGLDEDENLWGVAVLSVQADIPNTLPGQNVTMLIFGDSQLEASSEDASAFFFSTGIGQLACDEAPNGMLIQTPEGVGEINLSVNNISIELGSTAFITAEAEGDFTFALLEGHANLESGEISVEIAGGEFSTISLDEDLNPQGEFSEVQAIESHLELPQLPISILPRDISDLMPNADSSEVFVPRHGNWEFETTFIDATDACPSVMRTAMQRGTEESGNLFVDFGGEDWDFETFYTEATLESTGTAPLEGTYSSPEPNVYVYETEGGGDMAAFVFTLEVLSETEILGHYEIDASEFMAGCIITTGFTAIWNE